MQLGECVFVGVVQSTHMEMAASLRIHAAAVYLCTCSNNYPDDTHKNKPMSLAINHSLYLTVTPFTHLPPTLGNGTKRADY